jgi:hypothetical protein
VFDEVHFGAFAGQYIRREYYFDVHPPLAKMLNALGGWLVGFKGDFGFDNIGDKYETEIVKVSPRPKHFAGIRHIVLLDGLLGEGRGGLFGFEKVTEWIWLDTAGVEASQSDGAAC